MKKVLSIVLAIAMIATMSVVSFAAADSKVLDALGTAEVPVAATYAQGEQIDTYKVTVAWDDFTYSFGSTETWNPNGHTWDLTEGDGEWTIAAKNITVTNDSSLDVVATAAYNEGGKGSFTFANNGATVDAWTDNSVAGTATIVATWDAGDLTIQEDTALGTITVTIAAVA